MKSAKLFTWSMLVLLVSASALRAGDADLAIPDLREGYFTIMGQRISAWNLLFYGSFVIAGTLGISLFLRRQIFIQPAHKSMLDIAEVIFQTCKTYLIQQGKFLAMLFVLIAIAISYYLIGFGHDAKYGMTDRTIQELKLEQNVPDPVLMELRKLEKKEFDD